MTDPWDLKNLTLSPGTAIPRGEPKRIKKLRERFVKVDLGWIAPLDKCANATANTYRVAIHLLDARFQAHDIPVTVPNGWLEELGISRFAKYRALAVLKGLGMITVERRPRKSPIVSIIL
jgi:hypothetical protein